MTSHQNALNEPFNIRSHSKWLRRCGVGFAVGSLMSGLVLPSALAATDGPAVGLGTAADYSVLAGQAVTNTGATILDQNLGVNPGTAVTGFPPGIVKGTVHSADAESLQAQSDLVVAYDDAAGRAPTASISGDIVGQTLPGGVYKSDDTLALSGTLTLDGQNDPNSVFIFQVGSALTTASASNINMINGAQPCNVFWQVGSSATLGTDSTFKGTLMTLTSATVTTGTVVEGRVLARNGQVSLDDNVFTIPGCDMTPIAVTPTPTTPTEPTVPAPTTPAEPTTPAPTPNNDTPATPGTPPSDGDVVLTPPNASIPPGDSLNPPNDGSNPPADSSVPGDGLGEGETPPTGEETLPPTGLSPTEIAAAVLCAMFMFTGAMLLAVKKMRLKAIRVK